MDSDSTSWKKKRSGSFAFELHTVFFLIKWEVSEEKIRVIFYISPKIKAIFLGNLHFKTHEDEIREAFKDCGEISDVRLVRDSSTGIGKGFGYVNFADRDSVETALSLNGTKVSANF